MNSGSAELPSAPYTVPLKIPAAYRFGTASIDVEVDDPDAARWLHGFLAPWFSIAASTGTGVRLRSISNPDPFSALSRRERERTLQPFPCFGLDSMLVSLPGWIESDGTTLVIDRELGCYYRVWENQVDVISRPQDRQARIGLMRVLRELAVLFATAHMEAIDLHASAFVFRGRAILLAGGKKAGKTTLLAHALASRDTALMANDRILVDGLRLNAYGVPTIVSVRKETEGIFPRLRNSLPRRAFLLHEGESASEGFADSGPDKPLALSPAQFARRLNARIEPQAPVGAILFPQISSSRHSLLLESPALTDTIAYLHESIYGSRSATRGNTIFQKISPAIPNANARDALLNQLPASVPMFRCLLGRNAYDESPDSWLKTLPIANGTATR